MISRADHDLKVGDGVVAETRPSYDSHPQTTETIMETTTEVTALTQEQLSHSQIKKHMLGAMAVALIPVPGIDLAAVAGVQIKMLASLSKIYHVPFKENRAKHIIAGLVGSFGANAMATGLVASAVKIIPVIGQLGGAVAMPVVAGAATYAVGKVFV